MVNEQRARVVWMVTVCSIMEMELSSQHSKATLISQWGWGAKQLDMGHCGGLQTNQKKNAEMQQTFFC